jgi:hypothetical protein
MQMMVPWSDRPLANARRVIAYVTISLELPIFSRHLAGADPNAKSVI